MTDIDTMLEAVRTASRELSGKSAEQTSALLMDLSFMAEEHIDDILRENARDLAAMSESNPKYDRLKLTEERIRGIAADMRKVATLPCPYNRILEERTLPNGLNLQKISVPMGVIGIIYEARPNVTFDVFSLCLRSGNACVLKGGSDAENSNRMIISLIRDCLKAHGFDENTAVLLPSDRESTSRMLNARGYIDLIIPRGGKGLISFVRDNAKIPVIETGAGIVHTYFDKDGDLDLGRKVITNAKTRRVSVCNALDCLIIHSSRLNDLHAIVSDMASKNVIIYADPRAKASLVGKYPENLLMDAGEDSFGTEFLDYKMSVKTVHSLEEALDHIDRFGSKHSEAIISANPSALNTFLQRVDAAAVYANTSTAFTDGGQFGLGAEIGISTQKLHARGPMALDELCIYKWVVRGNGQTRN